MKDMQVLRREIVKTGKPLDNKGKEVFQKLERLELLTRTMVVSKILRL